MTLTFRITWSHNRACLSSRFRDIRPQNPCAHTKIHTQTHASSDFIFCPMQCIALDRHFINHNVYL